MQTTRKLTLTIAATALLIYSAGLLQADEPAKEEWVMEITPAQKTPAAAPTVMMTTANGTTVAVDQAEYQRIYNSIPFRRSEYNVNPNYRHDSAMEILTGNARHQTVIEHEFEHKQPTTPIPAPARPSRILTPLSGWGFLYGMPYRFGAGWGPGWGF